MGPENSIIAYGDRSNYYLRVIAGGDNTSSGANNCEIGNRTAQNVFLTFFSTKTSHIAVGGRSMKKALSCWGGVLVLALTFGSIGWTITMCIFNCTALPLDGIRHIAKSIRLRNIGHSTFA